MNSRMRLSVFIVSLLIAPSGWANPIPDGDFASGDVPLAFTDNSAFEWGDTHNLIDTETYVDTGFFCGTHSNPKVQTWMVVDGRMVRNVASEGNSARAAGSVWNADHTLGGYSLQFDYEWNGVSRTGGNPQLWVKLFLYKDLGTNSAASAGGLVWADRMDLADGARVPDNGVNSNFQKTQLAAVNLAALGAATTTAYTLNFTLPDDLQAGGGEGGEYVWGDRLALKIYALDLAGDSQNGFIAFDNFAIVAALGPIIEVQPQHVTILLGENAELSVTASSEAEPLTYQWYQGSTGDMSNPIPDAGDATYITPIFANTGPRSYWVRVTDDNGDTVDSQTATVTVAPIYDGIPDGDFASGAVQPAANNDRVADREAHVDGGFYYGAWSLNAWTVTDGRLIRNFALAGNEPRGVASVWNADHEPGNYALQFDFEWDSTDTNGTLMVQLFAYRDLGAGAASGAGLVYADRIEVGNSHAHTPANGGSSNFEKTLLAQVDLAPSGLTDAVETYPLMFTLDEALQPAGGDRAYGDRLVLRIYAHNLGSDPAGVLAFDQFRVVATDQPAPPIGLIEINAGTGDIEFLVPLGHTLARVEGATALVGDAFNWQELTLDVHYTVAAGVVSMLPAEDTQMIRIWLE